MPDKKHPYISSSGPITQAVTQFRKSFPQTVTADTLKKLSIASSNESYLINILSYLGYLDSDGKKTNKADSTFVKHSDEEFQASFADDIKAAYDDLFELHGDDAWKLEDSSLISFFRQSDSTSDVVGRRQANTFKTLAGIAGQREAAAVRTQNVSAKKTVRKTAAPEKNVNTTNTKQDDQHTVDNSKEQAVNLTVRVEVNLPSDASQ